MATRSTPTFTLVPRASRVPTGVQLDDDQLRVVHEAAADRHRHVQVTGGPGTGKTTLIVDLVRELGDGTLVLAATRPSATALRERLAASVLDDERLGAVRGVLARTAASFAFELVTQALADDADAPVRMLTGSEHDALLAELIDGQLADGRAAAWAPLPPSALTTLAFRTELRELLMSMAGLGVSSARLRELATGTGRAAWAAVADLADELETVLANSGTDTFDSAQLVAMATSILEGPAGDRLPLVTGLRTVIVDDAEECTEPTRRLLRALATRGVQLVTLGDPDVASQTFRGAVPRTAAALGELLPPQASLLELSLTRGHRLGAQAHAVVTSLIGRIGVAGRATGHRQLTAAPHVSSMTAISCSTPAAELRQAALALRTAHVRDGVPWSRLAVIVRSGAAAARVSRGLEALEVPISTGVQQAPVRDELVVQHLLRFAQIALGELTPSRVEVDELLRGPLVGLSAVDLRRLRHALSAEAARAAAAAAGAAGEPSPSSAPASGRRVVAFGDDDDESAGSATAVPQSLAAPAPMPADGAAAATSVEPSAPASRVRPHELLRRALLEGVPREVARSVRGGTRLERASDMIESAREAVGRGASVQQLLWRIWASAGIADDWRAEALGVGPVAQQANRALDALLALFKAAERFVEREPDGRPERFIERFLTADVPEDVLVPTGTRDAVQVLTPSAAIGVEAHTVVVMGVQEGVWPNTTLRNTALGGDELADLIAGRERVSEIEARAAVITDELRMLSRALSRAERATLVLAVADEDAAPSPFFHAVTAALARADDLAADSSASPAAELVGLSQQTGQEPSRVAVPPERAFDPGESMTLRELVGRLRRVLTSQPGGDTGEGDARESEELRAEAARALADLADAGIAGASVDEWWGSPALHPLGAASHFDDVARVSPSEIERFEQCPLDWFVARFGDSGSSVGAGLGTIVHAAAETGWSSRDELWQRVEPRLDELDSEAPWQRERNRRLAETLVSALDEYARDVRQEGATIADTEISYEVRLPGLPGDRGVLLRGQIDRVEVQPGGAVRIADLKTGEHAKPTRADIQTNAQLGAYQLAYLAGALSSALPEGAEHTLAGARLVLLRKPIRGSLYDTAEQSAFTPEEQSALIERIGGVAHDMSENRLAPAVEGHCLKQFTFGECAIHIAREVTE